MNTISTPRLLLRPPQDGDAGHIVRGLNNFAVSRWTARIPYPYGAEDAADFLAWARNADADDHFYAITRDGALIGVISDEACEIGYWLAEPFWGQGFGREAARAIADHAFEALNRTRLIACYELGNIASRRILAGLGFIETGESISHSLAQGAEVVVMNLELTPANWRQAKERRR
jgi:RimJ/RimL family protein N-acetyltransferase